MFAFWDRCFVVGNLLDALGPGTISRNDAAEFVHDSNASGSGSTITDLAYVALFYAMVQNITLLSAKMRR